MHYLLHRDTPLGKITLASDGRALLGLWFDGQKYFGDRLSGAGEEGNDSAFARAEEWLDLYFSGRDPNFTPPLSWDGVSPFRRRVWEILCEIPYGRVTTYGNIARRIAAESGKNVSAQAVGGAVGHNSFSLIIPCHRVVGADGSLTGYAGGLNIKERLLKGEGVDVRQLSSQKKVL